MPKYARLYAAAVRVGSRPDSYNRHSPALRPSSGQGGGGLIGVGRVRRTDLGSVKRELWKYVTFGQLPI